VNLRAAVWLLIGSVAVIAAAATSVATSSSRASTRPVGTNGFRWERVVTASAPSARSSAPVAYDPAIRQLVLIGGVRQVNPTLSSPVQTETILDDTWVFANNDWSQMTSGPTPPVGTQPDVVAYDPARKALILVTAPTFAKDTTRVTQPSTTWAWTGSQWTETFGSGPDWGTRSALMTYDVATRQLVFAPGYGPGTDALGTSGWMREPKPPHLLWMAYDPVTRRLVGETSESMWWWSGRRWHLLERRVVVHVHADSVYANLVESANWVTDDSAGEIVVFGDFYKSTASPVHTPHPSDLFAWLGRAWHPIETVVNPAPDNPQNFSLAYDGAIRGVIAFGGDEGVFTSSGGWITGGNSTWKLVRSR
jgi:hypothetical protein